MSSEHAYLSVFTREAMAKTLALRDEQIERLEAENAKLRKLCADMFKMMKNMDFEWRTLADFKTIAEASECYDFGQSIAPDYEGRVRELGIEVKDA